MGFAGVVFDWRGTLVTTVSEREWVGAALRLSGRGDDPGPIVAALAGAAEALDPPGCDCDQRRHRAVFSGVFADLGFDAELAEALYAVESDAAYNPFAVDVKETLTALRAAGVRVAVLSDIHFDIRPAFAAAGMGGLVDVFTLSFEVGAQKPDPAVFARTVAGLGTEDVLMVGDRSGPDGAAVEFGLTTLLVPPLRGVGDRRLHRVLALALG